MMDNQRISCIIYTKKKSNPQENGRGAFNEALTGGVSRVVEREPSNVASGVDIRGGLHELVNSNRPVLVDSDAVGVLEELSGWNDA